MLGRLFTIALFIISINTQAAGILNPQQLIDKVATQTLQRIEMDKQKIEADNTHLQTIVQEELMPFVDHRLTSKLVLKGVKVDKETRRDFYATFKAHLVITYAAIFSNYDGQELELVSTKIKSNNLQAIVKAVLKNKQKQDLNIDFKLRYSDREGQWKVYDLAVDGISMLNSKKAELKPMLSQPNGVELAIVALNSKIAKP